jgi:hypothetical protein
MKTVDIRNTNLCLCSKTVLFNSLEVVNAVVAFDVVTVTLADPSGRAVYGVGLRPSACRDRVFESHRGHGCLSCTVFVLSGRGLCDGPIPRPVGSYRLWCELECDQMKTQNSVHLL